MTKDEFIKKWSTTAKLTPFGITDYESENSISRSNSRI